MSMPNPYPTVIVGENFSTMPKGMSKGNGEITMTILFYIRDELRSFIEVRFTLPSEAGDEPVIASWFLTKENIVGHSFETVAVTRSPFRKRTSSYSG